MMLVSTRFLGGMKLKPHVLIREITYLIVVFLLLNPVAVSAKGQSEQKNDAVTEKTEKKKLHLTPRIVLRYGSFLNAPEGHLGHAPTLLSRSEDSTTLKFTEKLHASFAEEQPLPVLGKERDQNESCVVGLSSAF